MKSYLRAIGNEHGLLLNFAKPTPKGEEGDICQKAESFPDFLRDQNSEESEKSNHGEVMTAFGTDYAQAYDALYQDKDYERECDFLEAIFGKCSKKVKTVLDLGCGTGGHALILARRGYEVVGVDRSATMLEIAREKAKEDGLAIEFHQDDVTALNLRRTFDAVISMFAVMGYQISNADLSAACATARKHLIPNGIFIFDAWHGPAVLMDRPIPRFKEVRGGDGRIIRFTEPILDTFKHTVDVRFKLLKFRQDGSVVETDESHLMRYLFPQEIAYFLEVAGFDKVNFCPFMDLEGALMATDWNMTVIAIAGNSKGR